MENIFMRDEKKYLITTDKAAVLQMQLARHMTIDRLSEYLVQNIYFDTDSWDIIRESIEKPLYKEKLRLRFYDQFNSLSKGYLELKKKYEGIVYKRRMAFPLNHLKTRGVREIVSNDDSQISREISFFLQNNPVYEKIYLAYKRIAYNGVEEKDFRVTFDRDVIFSIIKPDINAGKLLNFNFHSECSRQPLNHNQIIMEIKAAGAIPMWFTRTLSELKIFPVSISKAGTCYALHAMNYYNPQEEKNAA